MNVWEWIGVAVIAIAVLAVIGFIEVCRWIGIHKP